MLDGDSFDSHIFSGGIEVSALPLGSPRFGEFPCALGIAETVTELNDDGLAEVRDSRVDRRRFYYHRAFMEEKCTFEYRRRHFALYDPCTIHFYRIIIQFYFDRVKKCANIFKCQER